MVPDELSPSLSAPVTRRKVVATGAKIAYATPAVAAAFKLSSSRAAAQVVSGECTNGENCGAGVISDCGPDGACACVTNVDGGFSCVERVCSPQSCTTGSDCASGLCISAPGCCGDPNPFCATACPDAGGGSLDKTWH